MRKRHPIRSLLTRALCGVLAALLLAASPAALSQEKKSFRLAWSIYAGWVPWHYIKESGLIKKWADKYDIEIEIVQINDYIESINQYTAGEFDGVTLTSMDALSIPSASGVDTTVLLIGDYSNGNDMIVGKPGVKSLKDLKGKKVGVEIGFVDHLLLLNGLEKAGMTESDVELVNVPTNETPQVLATGDVDAIGAWQPSSGQALKLVPGSKPIYTSADEPGLIYDVLAVNPASLSARRAEWAKVVKVWYRVVDYIHDPATQADAVKIMAARVGIKPAEYLPLLQGTKILTLAEAKKFFGKGDGFDSIYGSSKRVDAFNLKYEVYKQSQNVDGYIDPSITTGM